MMKRNIVLVGMMGSGKSHIGRKLAQRLKWQFVDTDRRLERAVGMTIAEFYNEAGEPIFREREINVLHQVSRYHEAVISFGGNFPIGRHIGKRPTVDYDDLHNFVRTMMEQWEDVYPYCDFTIDTTRGGASYIVDTIVEAIHKEKIQFAKRDRGGKTHEH